MIIGNKRILSLLFVISLNEYNPFFFTSYIHNTTFIFSSTILSLLTRPNLSIGVVGIRVDTLVVIIYFALSRPSFTETTKHNYSYYSNPVIHPECH
jgi:hypothetical protein